MAKVTITLEDKDDENVGIKVEFDPDVNMIGEGTLSQHMALDLLKYARTMGEE